MKTPNKLCANTSCTHVQDLQNHSCIVLFFTAIYSAGLESPDSLVTSWWIFGLRSIWYLHQNTDKTIINTVVARKDSTANHQHSGKMGENHLSLIRGNYVCAPKGAYFQNKRIQSKETHDKTWYFGGVPVSIPFLCKPRLDFEPI